MTGATWNRIERRLTHPALVAVWFAAYAALALGWVRHASATFDEGLFLVGGASYWTTGDFRLYPEGGVLAQYWTALPSVLSGRVPRWEGAAWRQADAWGLARQHLHPPDADPAALLLPGRCMTVLLGLALVALVFRWTRRRIGPGAALATMALMVVSPELLAHGALMTSDVLLALALFGSATSLWALLHRVRPWSLFVSALWMTAAFLAKMSGALAVLVGLGLMGTRLCTGRPTRVEWGNRRWNVRGLRRWPVFAGVVAVHAAVVMAGIWAAYGFRYAAARGDAPGAVVMRDGGWDQIRAEGGAGIGMLDGMRRAHVLPESYLYGMAVVSRHGGGRKSFLAGEYSLTGWRSFFPIAFLVKTPLGVLALLFGGVLLALEALRRRATEEAWTWRSRMARAGLRVAPVFWLAAGQVVVAVSSGLNIGLRHLLPAYPALWVAAGAAAVSLGARRPILAVGLVLLAAIESLAVWPHPLAFFNRLAGGPAHGHQWLVDSSLDWGQDLPGLARHLAARSAEQAAEPVYLSYFGTADPAAYGVRATLLPGHLDGWREKRAYPLTGGTYAISATMLQSVYSDAMGPWCVPFEEAYRGATAELGRLDRARADPAVFRAVLAERGERGWGDLYLWYEQLRLARLCAWLRAREPDGDVGGSILLYRLSDAQVHEALSGPPVELEPEVRVAGLERLERR